MSKRATLAALLLPAALFWSTGCKSKSTAPEQASQPAQTSAAPAGNPAAPAGPAASPSSPAATAAQPAPATSQPAGASAPVATNVPAPAPAPPPPPPPPLPPPPIVVPAGTSLHVTLVQAVGSKISEEGQPFDATLSSSVVVKGQKAIPAGARAAGTVVQAHASGRFKGGATLIIELNSINVNGKTYTIHTSQISNESKGKGKRTTAMIGGGTAGGALIGGLAGGGKGALIGGAIGAGAGTVGAATGNRDITLKSESPLIFKLTSSLTLPPRTSNSAEPSDRTPLPESAPPQP